MEYIEITELGRSGRSLTLNEFWDALQEKLYILHVAFCMR